MRKMSEPIEFYTSGSASSQPRDGSTTCLHLIRGGNFLREEHEINILGAPEPMVYLSTLIDF